MNRKLEKIEIIQTIALLKISDTEESPGGQRLYGIIKKKTV